MNEHPPKDGMLWCHICKDYAFPKTSFGSVASLDCGHIEKREGAKQSVQDYTPSYHSQPARARGSRTAPRKAPPIIDVQVKPAPVFKSSRSVSGTGNIANAIRDLMDRK